MRKSSLITTSPSAETFNSFIEKLREAHKKLFENRNIGLHRHILYHFKTPPSELLNEHTGRLYEERSIRGLKDRGIEAIAVYVPFHLTRSWGIFVFVEKLCGLAYHISRRTCAQFDKVLALCNKAIIRHESFHFQTEYSATIMETVIMKPLYLTYFERSRPYDPDEEALANAWMITSRFDIRGVRDELMRLCDMSPPGYRDYRRHIIDDRFMSYDDVRRFWAQKFLNEARLIFLPVKVEMPAGYRLVPIYYVSDAWRKSLIL